MKILDVYSLAKDSLQKNYKHYDLFDRNESLYPLREIARNWELNQEAIEDWLRSPIALKMEPISQSYIQSAPEIVSHVEKAFGRELPGTLTLMPSFHEFDGFARYDLGEHQVIFGVDFPDADFNYLKALTAHELSHVYRDHSPEVWSHLKKPLSKITRKEYLEAGSAEEHLVSEGLATLFSQTLFPEIPPEVHHYYFKEEWQWCLDHQNEIDLSFKECLRSDRDVWSFYSENRIKKGSPSRTQYFWAAQKIAERLKEEKNPLQTLIELHQKPASSFIEFL